jgi:uncharacterized protein
MRSVFVLCLLASLFWFLMFSPGISLPVNFWLLMTLTSGILAGASLGLQKKAYPPIYRFHLSHIKIALVATAVLYLLFFVGNLLVRKILPFGSMEIEGIYGIKKGTSPALVGFLLIFWIGPAEEVFWKGFVQYRLARQLGDVRGYLLASLIYGLVHIWALNLTLFIAALICGLFWGVLFLRYKSIWPGLISHAIWDVLIFILFPLG